MKPGYDGSIRIDTKIDSQGFNQGISSITKSMAGFAKVFALSKIIQGLVQLGKEAISVASDLQEVQNVVDTAFGSMSNQVEEFSKTAIDNFGLSELAAKRTSSTYMAMSKGMGITGQAAADMAIDVAGLTGDVASFYNVSQSISDTALKSIWTGETESLKQFGVVMTQANLQQFAYTQGIDKKISAMSQAEQVMLRYQFVTKQLGLAQGDFAKTSGSWANQVRILTERWKEFLGLIGNVLMEILFPVVKLLNNVLELLISILKKVGEIYTALTGKKLVKSNNAIADSANAAADSELNFADGINDATKAAKGALASFDELNVIQGDIGSGTGGGLDLGLNFPTDLGDGINEAESNIKGLNDEFDKFFISINDKFKGLGDTLAIPVKISAPVFAEIPNPVYHPNWGLDLPYIQKPVFAPIPNPIYKPMWNLDTPTILEPVFPSLPAPIYNPAWNLNDSLVVETGLVSQTVTSFSDSLLRNLNTTYTAVQLVYTNALSGMQSTSQNVMTNAYSMSETVAANFETWKNQTSMTISEWAANITNAVYGTAQNSIGNINSFLQTTNKNVSSWINTTSGNFATWGNSVLFTTRETSKGFVDTFVSGLQTAWSNFVSFMKSTGEKMSVFWTANKSWLAPTIVITGGALALGAIALSGGALTPALAAIPMLATGAVIPPNSEFLAILGDQKSGRNIETPESLLRQIVREELGGMMKGGDITIENIMNLDGDVVYRDVKKIAWEQFKRTGESPFPA